jgi:response regulator baeR
MAGRVLIVDDDVWFADQLARTVKKAGYRATCVRNGVEAMIEIDSARPDVIVLDFFMLGPNGLVLLHELQSHSDLATIPVILCTNIASDIKSDTLEQYGVRCVLDKTAMEPSDVVTAVRKVLL